MSAITLAKANRIITAAFAKGKELDLAPLTVVVLGKAWGALALGMGSRKVGAIAVERPHFFQGLSGVSGGRMVPVPGGVLVRDKKGAIIGAVGITGDTSDNDEACAIAGIEAAGFTPDAG